jgi:hypothetical protein
MRLFYLLFPYHFWFNFLLIFSFFFFFFYLCWLILYGGLIYNKNGLFFLSFVICLLFLWHLLLRLLLFFSIFLYLFGFILNLLFLLLLNFLHVNCIILFSMFKFFNIFCHFFNTMPFLWILFRSCKFTFHIFLLIGFQFFINIRLNLFINYSYFKGFGRCI